MIQRRDSHSLLGSPPRPDTIPMPHQDSLARPQHRYSAHSTEAPMRGLIPVARWRSPSVDDFGDAQTPRSELYDEIQRLKSQLDRASARAQEAEEQARGLTERLGQINQAQESQSAQIEALESDRRRSDRELQHLASELDDARSHIFSLQPYRKDLTPDEASGTYDELVNAVSDWVFKFIEPVLDDPDACKAVLKRAQKNSNLKENLRKYWDILITSEYADTDPDVVASLVMKLLYRFVFDGDVLYGIAQDVVRWLGIIERNMGEKLEPKRDLFTVRSWRAESYAALIASEGFAQAKRRHAKEIASDITQLFEAFARDKKQVEEMTEALYQRCIIPAMDLHERFITSTDMFYLDDTQYVNMVARRPVTASEFYLELPKLECRNVLDNMKTFDAGKLRPTPGPVELREHLSSLCTMAPALHMRKVGKGQDVKEAVLVCKQKMLVAWGDAAKHERATTRPDPRLMQKIVRGQR